MRRHPQFLAYVALAAVCFFWGTTYLGIRMALESVPPLALISLRFTLSGALLLGFLAWRGEHVPRGQELWRTALFGIIILGGGTGALVFAEQWIPSGLASLFITLGPFWLIAAEALIPGGEKPAPAALLGMVVGLCGVAFLVRPENGGSFSAAVVRGFLVLQLGCFLWGIGSILQRRLPTMATPIMSGAIQQLAAGLAYAPFALLVHEHAITWNARGLGAVLYLVTFGSIVGYSSYIYAMEKLPVALVTIYNYVNPVVAVTLGWLIYREELSMREGLGMLIIFAGVAIVKRYGHRQTAVAQRSEAVNAATASAAGPGLPEDRRSPRRA